MAQSRDSVAPSGSMSAAGHLGDLGREVVGLLLDPLAPLVADEMLDFYIAPHLFCGAGANLIDARSRHDHRLLLEEANLGVPLVEFALDDLGPGLHGLGL